jgi:hydroxyethylthiazole kinase-like uncharacterized protein yjeF
MRLATLQEMKAVEIYAEKELKLSPEILMETAGILSAREIQNSFLPELRNGKVAVICGPGNNGGDGLVLARHLYAYGFLGTEVFIFDSSGKKSNLFTLQLERVKKSGVKLNTLNAPKDLVGFSLYVIDVIEFLNSSKVPVVSLDIPTGLDSMTDKFYGACVRASSTLTFGASKPSLYGQKSVEYVGKIRVVPLGISQSTYHQFCNSHFVVNEAWAKRLLPVKSETSNKFSRGRLYVRAGSPGTWGAAALSCQGAYRMGAGYVTLVTSDESEAKLYLGQQIGPEVLMVSQDDPKIFAKTGAIIAGPGAGVNKNLRKFIEDLINQDILAVVIDADGLTVLAEMKKENPDLKLPQSWLLTPHSGELSRLLDNIPVERIESERIKYAMEASAKWGCHILLKGLRTLVITPDMKVAFVTSGNSALAKAGTGDVLSGFIGSLMAQGLETFEAATTGAYIHGRVADDWIREGQNINAFIASDLIGRLSSTLQRLTL